jgi:hypothetical protein
VPLAPPSRGALRSERASRSLGASESAVRSTPTGDRRGAYAYCPVAGTIFRLPSNAFATTAVAAPRISAASEPTVNMP